MRGKKKAAPRKTSTARRLMLNTTTRVRFLVRLSIAIALLAWSGWCTYLGIDSTAWPSVTGTITEARIDNVYSGRLVYSYQVGSKVFTSDNVRFGDLWCLNSVGELVGQYQAGSTIPVLYCPQYHAIACL
ncbi:MAG: DUF3592 domain-containing protein, partial [Cyanobacteria bacterium]|nr:DUF3592 domain-containing protein [Cyanobacteriota bacterium]